MTATLKAIRNTPPTTRAHLADWVASYTGVRVARAAVCAGHSAPFDAFASWWLDTAPVSLFLGPRGGGKSFLSAIDTHLRSRFHPRYETRILGGSKAQSEQIYRALKDVVRDGRGPLGSDADTVASLLESRARYKNGSEVDILAASPTSVRGPHVPSLKLDEVDEIEPEIREAALGMAMGKHGRRSQVLMSSTWHRLNGPMSDLIAQAEAGRFPLHRFCLFEVLERCPASRSGPGLEKCPACPLVAWCREDPDPKAVPKAKRSDGHYPIESAIQKVIATSARSFASDFLCRGPKVSGLWFPTFARETHASNDLDAEYKPNVPVYLSIDGGVFTGAVFFQVRRWQDWNGLDCEEVNVFADHLAEGATAEANARALRATAGTRCNDLLDTIVADPAGDQRNPVGPSVIAEWERAGLKPVRRWPVLRVADSLATLEAFINPAAGPPRIKIHSRCTALIQALSSYRRRKLRGQYLDLPEDPQHPFEDLVDALRGGLGHCFPGGRRNPPEFRPGNSARFAF